MRAYSGNTHNRVYLTGDHPDSGLCPNRDGRISNRIDPPRWSVLPIVHISRVTHPGYRPVCGVTVGDSDRQLIKFGRIPENVDDEGALFSLV